MHPRARPTRPQQRVSHKALASRLLLGPSGPQPGLKQNGESLDVPAGTGEGTAVSSDRSPHERPAILPHRRRGPHGLHLSTSESKPRAHIRGPVQSTAARVQAGGLRLAPWHESTPGQEGMLDATGKHLPTAPAALDRPVSGNGLRSIAGHSTPLCLNLFAMHGRGWQLQGLSPGLWPRRFRVAPPPQAQAQLFLPTGVYLREAASAACHRVVSGGNAWENSPPSPGGGCDLLRHVQGSSCKDLSPRALCTGTAHGPRKQAARPRAPRTELHASEMQTPLPKQAGEHSPGIWATRKGDTPEKRPAAEQLAALVQTNSAGRWGAETGQSCPPERSPTILLLPCPHVSACCLVGEQRGWVHRPHHTLHKTPRDRPLILRHLQGFPSIRYRLAAREVPGSGDARCWCLLLMFPSAGTSAGQHHPLWSHGLNR